MSNLNKHPIGQQIRSRFIDQTGFSQAISLEALEKGENPLFNRQKIQTGSVRNSLDTLAISCWTTKKNGEFFIRQDFLNADPPIQARFILPDNLHTPAHSHNHVEFTIVLEGVFRQNICGKDEVFQSGEICLIDKDSPHYDIITHEDSLVIFLSIDNIFFKNTGNQKSQNSVNHFLQELISERKQKYKFIRFHPKTGTDNELNKILELVLEEFWEKRAGSEMLIRGYVQRLLSLLPDEYSFSLSKAEKAQMRRVMFNEVKQFISENFHEISITDLCQRFNYNEDYFNRLIKQFSGLTYSKYLQNVRLHQAAGLLKNTDLSVTEVAAQVGYANMGYFYKIFVQMFGVTPNAYRTGSSRNLSPRKQT